MRRLDTARLTGLSLLLVVLSSSAVAAQSSESAFFYGSWNRGKRRCPWRFSAGGSP